MTLGITVFYVAHPVAGDVSGNIARTLRWIAWLMRSNPDTAFCCPWIPMLLAGDTQADDEPAARARGLRDDIAMAKRCDGIVLVGGRVSSGMQAERDGVYSNGGVAVDLTHLGEEPPHEAMTIAEAVRVP